MKSKILPASLIAAAGLVIAPALSRGQSTTQVSVDNGADLYLGFEESGNANNLIVDLGSYTQFLDASAPFTIQFGVIPTGQAGAGDPVTNLSADLNSIFSGWAASSGAGALKWGVIGVNDGAYPPVLFLTQDSANTTPPGGASYGNIFLYDNAVGSLATTLATDFSTVNSTEAASVPATATLDNPNSWTSFNPYTNAFGTGLDIEQAPGDGPLSTLDLFEDVPTEGGGGPTQEIGQFALGSNGALTFTPVPEPSTWMSIISGAAFLGFFRPRRRRLSAS